MIPFVVVSYLNLTNNPSNLVMKLNKYLYDNSGENIKQFEGELKCSLYILSYSFS